MELLVLVNLGVVKFGDDCYSVGNIDYDTIGDFQMDLLQLVRIPTWITFIIIIFFFASPHKRGRKIRTSNLHFIRHDPNRLNYFLGTTWITLYWKKEVSARRTDGIRFFQGWPEHKPYSPTGRTKNSTRQLHESFVIKWLCKCEYRTHRESHLCELILCLN
jgi:hypothetical protein